MRRSKLRFRRENVYGQVLILISSVLFISGCSFLPKEEEVIAPSLIEPVQIEYKTVEAKESEIARKISGTGALVPVVEHDVSYKKDGGRLKEIKVKNGDTVTKDQVLAEFEVGNLAVDLEQMRIDLKKAQLRLQQLQAEQADYYSIEIAKLDVESMSKKVNQLNNEIVSSKVYSPTSGTISFVTDIKQGSMIPAFETLFRVYETGNLEVEYSGISGDDMADVKKGMEAVLRIKAEEFSGEVLRTPEDVPEELMEKNPEKYKGTIMIQVKDLPEDFKIGEMVGVEITLAQKEKALVIPRNALRKKESRYFVQTLEEQAKREVDVEIGIMTSTEVEIIEGLEVGDNIILK